MEDYSVNSLAKYFTAPLQVICLLALVYVVKRFFFRQAVEETEEEPVEPLEPMKKRDFTLEELKEYDGTNNQRILIAVNGNIFDVSRGKHYYGPGLLAKIVVYSSPISYLCFRFKLTCYVNFSCTSANDIHKFI